MSGPDATVELQKAIIAHLREFPDLVALVADRSFDDVPAKATKPYTSLGPIQVLPDIAHGYEGSEIFFQVDAWSKINKSTEVKRIGAAIRSAFTGDITLALENDQRLVSIEHQQTNYIEEPEAEVWHAALTFRALTEPTA